MINFNNDKRALVDACNLTEEQIEKIVWFIDFYDKCEKVSKCIERIWIDENIDDNTRAFALFTIGRLYEQKYSGRG